MRRLTLLLLVALLGGTDRLAAQKTVEKAGVAIALFHLGCFTSETVKLRDASALFHLGCFTSETVKQARHPSAEWGFSSRDGGTPPRSGGFPQGMSCLEAGQRDDDGILSCSLGTPPPRRSTPAWPTARRSSTTARLCRIRARAKTEKRELVAGWHEPRISRRRPGESSGRGSVYALFWQSRAEVAANLAESFEPKRTSASGVGVGPTEALEALSGE
jgi:hypothetical protein